MKKGGTLNYALACLFAVVFTWLLHEFTHWLCSEALGYQATMRLNSVSQISDTQVLPSHAAWISISGPLITLMQAFGVYFILVKKWKPGWYPILFTAFYMRMLAGFMNFIKPNDEGRVGEYLGLGLFTISLIMTAILFLLVYKISRQYQLPGKFQAWTILFIILFSSCWILADQFWGIRLLS